MLSKTQLSSGQKETLSRAYFHLTSTLQPGAIAELCGVLSTSQQPQVRQYAAVLLRYVVIETKVFDYK